MYRTIIAYTCCLALTLPVYATEVSLLPGTAVPCDDRTDGVNRELGVRFLTAVSGTITAIRFYKSANETGENARVGRIWSKDGELLASTQFTGETASGWQRQDLETPLHIDHATVYVVSVNTRNKTYAATISPAASPNTLTVACDAQVYGSPGEYPTEKLPDQSRGAEHFRDVVFVPDTWENDKTPPTIPKNLVARVQTGNVILTWDSSTDNVSLYGYEVSRDDSAIQFVPGQFNTTNDLYVRRYTTYRYSVRARDLAGNYSEPAFINVTTGE